MGMFDYLVCRYPLPDEGANDVEYQTKYTPSQCLFRYEITEIGVLRYKTWNCEDGLGSEWKGHPDFSEDIYFEGEAPDGRWLTYWASFRDGVLLKIWRA